LAVSSNPLRAKPGAAVEREEIAATQLAMLRELLEANTRLTEQVAQLTSQIHATVVDRRHSAQWSPG